ncbi:zinc finger, C6HC-type containing protein, partial [Tanacetum coccineum]
MAGSSIFDPCIIDDDDQNFPISVEKYAEQLQNKEARVFSSTSRASSSSSIKAPIVILDSEDSPASTSSSTKPPIVILDSEDSPASTSSSTKPPIVILDSEDSPASTSSSMKPPIVILESSQVPDRFCDICMDTKPDSEMFQNTNVCGHMYCFDCIRGHVAAKIQENITKVRCPDPNCKGVIGPEACRLIVPKEVLDRWENALCESLILGSEKFYCP